MRKLWSWVTWLTLLVVLAFSSPASPATYYLRNDGTGADPDCSGSSACCTGAYDEADYNGATFSASDIVKVCPHGGNFDLAIDVDATVGVSHEGVYDPQYGWPTFSEGVIVSGSGNALKGIEYRPGAASVGTLSFEGGRFGICSDTSRSWQAAEETAITDWNKSTVGFFAIGMGSVGGSTTPTPQLYWRDVTDVSSWAAVGSTGEVKYTDPGNCITDEGTVDDDSPGPSEFGTSSAKTQVSGVTCEQENSHQATSSTSLSADEYTELQVGISFADGDDAHKYEFSAYESGSPVGSASLASVTLATSSQDIAYDTSTSEIAYWSDGGSFSYTVTSANDNRVLIAQLYLYDSLNESINIPTYAGDSLTCYDQFSRGTSTHGRYCYLLDPDTGSNTFAYSSTDSGSWVINVMSLTNVKQQAPEAYQDANATGVNHIDLNLTTSTNKAWVVESGAHLQCLDDLQPDYGETERSNGWNSAGSDMITSAATEEIATAGQNTFGFSASPESYGAYLMMSAAFAPE